MCARGRFTFSLPPPPPRVRRLPHPARAGESPQDGVGGGGQRRRGGRRQLGDTGEGGAVRGENVRGLGRPLGNEVGRQSSLRRS